MGAPQLFAGACLALLLLWLRFAQAANSTYVSYPNVLMAPPLENTKLLLQSTFLILDVANQFFYLNVSTHFYAPGISLELPVATLSGSFSITSDQDILLSYSVGTDPSSTGATPTCIQKISSPPLCPTYLQGITGGPWKAAWDDRSGSNYFITITPASSYIDPNTGYPANFLGAQSTFDYDCIGTCEPLSPLIPSGAVNVRRRR